MTILRHKYYSIFLSISRMLMYNGFLQLGKFN
nr:MAG TPA: hypothetical protein [Caudoviricetes sp.]